MVAITHSWDHPTGPPNARSVAIAADRTEGDIIIEGVGEDSGESEWRAVGVGDGCVEWGIGERRRIDSHPVPVLSPFPTFFRKN